MIFISERIVNISELEAHIKNAELYFNIMQEELDKATPSEEIIDSAANVIKKSLKKASDFEFCLEQRKCKITTSCENPRFEGNHEDEDSED
ncbi:hypothetical protein [Anaerostipes faecalis]|jgi:hypothetical protein|uniref:hypothetical protein n=1 Tax=Anaerostipes faecalis TaxID=2738446 RepID=UPI00205B0AA3|nr:MAG TPA: hypothetical protein [Caudoviricetes sp.]